MTTDETLRILAHHIRGDLPPEIRVVHAPLRMDGYGDMVTVLTGSAEAAASNPSQSDPIETEAIHLSQHELGGVSIYLGYGRESKTLVIGQVNP